MVAAGLALLAGGATPSDLGATLLGSPEYVESHGSDAAFVAGLYESRKSEKLFM